MSNINQPAGSSTSVSGLADRASETLDQAKQKATEQAQKVAQAATEQAQKVAQTATDTVKSAAADLQKEATAIAGDAAERAKSFANENKGKVAEQIDSLGSVLNKAAEELETSNQPMIAGYARQLAGGVQTVSTTLRDKGVEELFGMVGSFARNQPAAFIGGAALLGFIASRFAVSSAKGARANYASQPLWAAGEGPEIREPWSSSDDSQKQSAWGDNTEAGGSTGGKPGTYGNRPTSGSSYAGGTSSSGPASTYGSSGNNGGGNNSWSSTRDTDGGTI